jgi:predicted nucleic acid-binding protein
MSQPHVDTDVIIRLLTGDDPEKQRRSRDLFEPVERGELAVTAPDTVIADAVFVLSSRSLYNLPRYQVAALLAPLVRLPWFRIRNRSPVLLALHFYGTTDGLDFGDAMVAASMRLAQEETLYSYDRDFDRLSGITRREP